MAQQAHHAAGSDPATTQMKEMCKKMSTTTDKTERKKLMGEHMQMMNKMMKQGGMMGDQGMMNCMKSNTMATPVQTLEKKMQVMQEMMMKNSQ